MKINYETGSPSLHPHRVMTALGAAIQACPCRTRAAREDLGGRAKPGHDGQSAAASGRAEPRQLRVEFEARLRALLPRRE
jgi:hypothetical protein